MKTSSRQAGAPERTYRKPSVLDRGTVELVTKDTLGDGRPENFGITFCWGDVPVARSESATESTEKP